MRPLIWLLERAWAGLYGTVTLEVFGHIDPRIVEHALLFRAMMDDQAVPLGLTDELPRLRKLITSMLAGLIGGSGLALTARGPSGCPRRP